MTTYRIAVGIDGSEHAGTAMKWALEEARCRGGSVQLVHGWASRVAAADLLGTALVASEQAGQEILAEATEQAHAIAPEVAVTTSLVPLAAPEALISLSEDVDHVVIGTRGRGGFTGLLLGSVSHQVVLHAHCPVTVVRSLRH